MEKEEVHTPATEVHVFDVAVSLHGGGQSLIVKVSCLIKHEGRESLCLLGKNLSSVPLGDQLP